MKNKLIFLLLLSASWNAYTENSPLSIQITATEAPNLAFFKESTGFESLYTEETESGLVRIKLGAYVSKKDAEKDLNEIKNKGFPDAFITSYTGKETIKPAAKPKKTPPILDEEIAINEPQENKLLPPSSSPAWSKLSEAQKRNIVYVDGILHLHEGDKFIPLSSY